MDYEKTATAAVQAMKAADLNRFLVACALVSDLQCPGYNPRQLLEKNANLSRTAAHYKINVARLMTVVRAELSTKTTNHQGESKEQPQSKSITEPVRKTQSCRKRE